MGAGQLSTRFHLKLISVMLLGGLFLAGCVYPAREATLADYTAPAAHVAWTPSAAGDSGPELPPASPDIPKNLLTPGAKWQLIDIIEVALRNSPQTRAAWYAARSAAADWLSQKGSYYPQIGADANLKRVDNLGAENRSGPDRTSLEPTVQLSWLLFDFGGRSASVEAKRRALLEADFLHNAAVQDQVFLVLQTYFEYLNARALEKALATSLAESTTNLQAARERHRNGMATIADVLQSQTALSQARLNLDDVKGQVQTLRGALATAMGIPANTAYDIEELPLNPPVDRIQTTVDDYIARAEKNRPDLAAQKNRMAEAQARARAVRSSLYPSFVFGDTLGGTVDDLTHRFNTDNTASLQLSIPIFTGGSPHYNLFKAKEDAKYEAARLRILRQNAMLEVWSSYFGLKTANQRVKTGSDLLASATRSHEVTLGRYKEGVGGLLDLLSAQSALLNARAQLVSAQTDWYISFSRLARDTGVLWTGSDADNKQLLDIFPTATIEEHQP
jgi:outer membrane protein